jgi:hypothetical protein
VTAKSRWLAAKTRYYPKTIVKSQPGASKYLGTLFKALAKSDKYDNRTYTLYTNPFSPSQPYTERFHDPKDQNSKTPN